MSKVLNRPAALTAVVIGCMLLHVVSAAAENYVEKKERLSWAESFRVYMEYFPKSVGM